MKERKAKKKKFLIQKKMNTQMKVQKVAELEDCGTRKSCTYVKKKKKKRKRREEDDEEDEEKRNNNNTKDIVVACSSRTTVMATMTRHER